jgi:hypothetical protein
VVVAVGLPQLRAWTKLALALGYAALIALQLPSSAQQWSTLALVPLAYGYFWMIAAPLHTLRDRYAAGHVGRLTVLAACFVTTWIVPTALLMGQDTFVFYMLASEIMLAAYSYCVEGRREPARTLAECRFFLLANPTLSWSDRARQVSAPRLQWRAVLRTGLGCAVMVAGLWVELWSAKALGGPTEVRIWETSTAAVGTGLAMFIALYAAHSGMASIRIGLMSLLGYHASECYVYPVAARSPRDFWTRWNRWVGGWFKRHVFVPLLRACHRRGIPRPLAYAAALMAALTCVGIYHDAIIWTSVGEITFRATAWFSAAGLVCCAWFALASPTRRWVDRWAASSATWLHPVLGALGYVVFLRMALAFALAW